MGQIDTPIPQRESTSTDGLRSHQLRVDRLEERIRIRVSLKTKPSTTKTHEQGFLHENGLPEGRLVALVKPTRYLSASKRRNSGFASGWPDNIRLARGNALWVDSLSSPILPRAYKQSAFALVAHPVFTHAKKAGGIDFCKKERKP